MESKTAQNVQDTYFNALRKDKSQLIIYLVNGVRVFGRIRSFDKYSVLVENGNQDQLVFKHAISTVVLASSAAERRPAEVRPAEGAQPIVARVPAVAPLTPLAAPAKPAAARPDETRPATT